MKKMEFTLEQIDQVKKLKESGQSWLSIENQTGIPRRIAQRVWVELEEKSMVKERKTIRRELMLENMREHQKLEIELAEDLVNLLNITLMPVPVVNFEDYLSPLWNKDRWPQKTRGSIQPVVYSKENIPEERTKEAKVREKTVERQNRILFQSLQDHTKNRVFWQAFTGWKTNWDSCQNAVQELKQEISLILEGKLGALWNSETKFEGDRSEIPYQGIADATVQIVWKAMLANLSGEDFPVSGDIQVGNNYATSPEDGDEVETVLRPIIENLQDELSRSESVRQIDTNLREMVKFHRELEENLNPLVLHPILLSTRCRLCPA